MSLVYFWDTRKEKDILSPDLKGTVPAHEPRPQLILQALLHVAPGMLLPGRGHHVHMLQAAWSSASGQAHAHSESPAAE